MPYIAERLLRLLSLLNAGHNWRGEDLAERMGVTPRTVRRDVDRFVAQGMSTGPYKWQARVLMDAPASVVADRVPPTIAVIEAAGDRQCVLVTGSDSLDAIAFHLAMVNVPFTPLDPPELKDRCAELSRRLSQAAAPSAL